MMNYIDSLICERKLGRVTCKIFRGSSIATVKDSLKSLNMLTTGLDYCKCLDQTGAKTRLIEILCFHLESDERVMNEDVAYDLVRTFLKSFPSETEYYVNEIWGGYEPLTRSFIDAGILAVKEEGLLGLLWVEDDEGP
ncbi:MAG: hypothetical protein P8X74_21175 [Reinekea sp.]